MAHLRLFQLLIRAAWLHQTPGAGVARVIHRVLIGLAGGLMLLGGPVLAEDPPTRVGSLNYISGEVSYALRGEEGEPGSPDALSWAQADFNQPVCQDMSLKTGAMARARVRIGPDAIQLSGGTSLNMLNLNDQLIEASVPYGRIHLRLSELDHGEVVELEMARGSLWLLQPGDYDLDTGAADQPTRIIVFSGKARFIGGESDLPIAAGHEVQVSGNYPAVVATERPSDEPAFKLPEPAQAATPATPPAAAQPVAQPTVPAPAAVEPKAAPAGQSPPALPEPSKSAEEVPSASPQPAPGTTPAGSQEERGEARVATAENPRGSSDDFLFWVEDSDNNPPPAQQSAQYVSAAATGSEALDQYGQWQTLPDAGPVWFPSSVPDGWTPYRFGHWESIPPWGWTWIDDQPWGFAPFHYGRWINIDGHWGWVPGAVVPDPVYAPALVAFLDAPDDSGGGPDGGPDVGWFPLGPGDDYVPWYAAGPAYVERVNVFWHGQFHDFAGLDRGGFRRDAWRGNFYNRRFATVVSRESFASSRRLDRALRPVSAERLERATVMRGAPRVMPAVMRSGEGFAGARGGPAAAAVGHAQPGGIRPGSPGEAERGRPSPAAGSRRNAPALATGRGIERPQQNFGHAETGHAGIGHNAAGPYRGNAQQFGRPQTFQNPAQAYRGNAQQFGRPQTFQNPAQAARGGMPSFGQPQMFHTPAASYRGAATFGQAAARPAPAASGGGHHK
ncbi:MAG: DUF6600 domain-containing protein [Stellaceae bacterium]